MIPPRPRTVPPWDLTAVLRALKGLPFEPVGELQALSVNPACLEFGPN